MICKQQKFKGSQYSAEGELLNKQNNVAQIRQFNLARYSFLKMLTLV